MRIAVLMGGVSSEREVSLASGKEVARALREVGHEVAEIDVKDELDTSHLSSSSGNNKALIDFVSNPAVVSSEIVFIALHGGAGEDGTVQALLDIMRKPYTGSGMLASALSMDKVLSKRIFEQSGIPTPDWRSVENADSNSIDAAVSSMGGLPVVTKPRNQGSTIGISIVKEVAQVAPAVESALKYSSDILVEKYIVGRELTVGILGDGALPVIEVAPEKGFYDYECKYTRGKSKYIVPAKIAASKSQEAQELALKAYRVLGCEDFARVDFRLSHEGQLQCLEVNTIPGMTGTSLVPMAARASGQAFPQLVDKICRLALSRRGIEIPARTS
jgi:D-alanine-D-alanine ligase